MSHILISGMAFLMSLLFPQNVLRIQNHGGVAPIYTIATVSLGDGSGGPAVTAGSHLLILCTDHAGAAYAPTDARGNTFNPVTSIILNPAATFSAQLFEADNVIGGAGLTNCNVTGGANNYAIYFFEYRDGLTTSAIDQHCEAGKTATTTPTVGPCTTSTQANDMVVEFIWAADGLSGAVSVGSGFTYAAGCDSTCPDGTFYTSEVGYKNVSAIGAYSCPFTFAGSAQSVVFCAILK